MTNKGFIMTLSEWIKEYCEENDIILPDGISDEETALLFIQINMNDREGE